MTGKWLAIGAVAVVAGVGGAALTMRLSHRRPAPPVHQAAALISTANEVTLTGKIQPAHITSVKCEVDGNVDAFLVDVGEDVFEGEVLARIGSAGLANARESASAGVATAQDKVSRAQSAVTAARLESSRADAARQHAQTSLDLARQAYEHQQKLYQAGATARLTYEKSQSELSDAQQQYDIMDKAARASNDHMQALLNELTAAQKDLADRNQALDDAQNNLMAAEVRSPVDGLVVARNGEEGKPAAEDLFEVATDMYALEVTLEPQPAVLKHLAPGQEALVLIPDLQSAGIEGVVKEINGSNVVVYFESTLPAIRPGMLADVRLKLN